MIDNLLYRDLYKKTMRIRLVEEDIIARYHTDKIQSPVHLSIGQESVAVGVCHALCEDDLLFSTYRSHAFYLAKGGDLKKMMAELYGK
jgi:pyruvate dehydrogenase E1 component alpha subunit